ncbi:hypothetical protein PAAG_05834 [Paracoccidioides lutzii Pb01]|uniref:Uncharacterized protein n=1 Tax=Paracoccidioides lutzii (strain ATCC MYA-826 / Pb01) TaxID=502779 RepID=C1H4Z3_PARBA|nr:hypothetical protein PAAG_05834 [Paracoccidioides lutzii Pb01]EEH34787.2 hypothetical protein PAAG_05834 [Paracoccidioides lutzii Pb01]
MPSTVVKELCPKDSLSRYGGLDMDTFEAIVILLVIVLIFTPTPVTQIWHWLAIQFGWEWLRPHGPPPGYLAPLLLELKGLRSDINLQLASIVDAVAAGRGSRRPGTGLQGSVGNEMV